MQSKCHKLPFPISETVINEPFALVHSDLWGPAPVKSVNGFMYYISFIDAAT